MKNIINVLRSPRIRISGLLTVSVLAILFCCINLPIVYVGLIELAVLACCIIFFRTFDVSQYELFHYKPHWFWRIWELYWTIWFCFNTLPFIQRLGDCYPTLKYAYFVYPSVFKPITDFAISNCGKDMAVRILSTVMLSPVILLITPIVFYVFRWLFKQIAEFFQSLTRFERCFLAISSSVLIAVLFIISSKTSFFVYPINNELYVINGKNILFTYCDVDLFFDADNFQFFNEPRYAVKADSFRHPAFSIVFSFFMPAISAIGALCNCFYSSSIYSFALGTAIIQIFVFVIAGILLKRMYADLTPNFERIILAIYICSFPVVFSLIPDRIMLSTFFIVAGIYTIIRNSDSNKSSLLVSLSASVTTLLSLIPVLFALTIYRRRFQALIIIACVGLIILGRGMLSSNHNSGIARTLTYLSDKSMSYNLLCYNQFLTSTITVPTWEKNIKTIPYFDKAKTFSTIWITQKYGSVIDTISGIIILLLCILSLYLYCKHTVIQVSFLWLLMSFLIIGLVGFGCNCCVLYCSYFSWAVIPLALLPFYWLWQKFPRLPIPQALYLFAAYLAISNLYFLYQVVQIVSEQYIVPPGM